MLRLIGVHEAQDSGALPGSDRLGAFQLRAHAALILAAYRPGRHRGPIAEHHPAARGLAAAHAALESLVVLQPLAPALTIHLANARGNAIFTVRACRLARNCSFADKSFYLLNISVPRACLRAVMTGEKG